MEQKNNKEPLGRTWPWQVSMGVPALLWATGAGFAMTGGTYFFPGVWLAYAATLIFCIGTYFQFRGWPIRDRVLSQVGTLALATIISWIAFHPAPINVLFQLREGDYPEGIEIAGIKWQKNFTDLRVIIRNNSDDDYSNIDITIRTDLVIAGAGAVTNYAQCVFSAPSNVKITEFSGVDDKGNKVTMPFIPVPNIQPIASIYRMRCDKLVSRDDIEMVLPLISFHFGANYPVGPRTKPSWLSMEAEYDGRGRSRKESYFKCFSNQCLHAQ